ncbi:MAG: NAD(P)H-binding protein, partial [Acetobacteraceae bacterium]|nr:NAD(P)H-binding protein [Acetobacteraceae bacterium]
MPAVSFRISAAHMSRLHDPSGPTGTMRVLVLGAGGFLGARIVVGLLSRGHDVICAGRSPRAIERRFPSCAVMHADLGRDDASTWRPKLAGIDAVVNAAGVLRGDLDQVHHHGPVALFEACAQANLSRVVQISALGAGEQSSSRFLLTKQQADEAMVRLRQERGAVGWCVLRPSLVIGRGGGSTALFCAVAAMPGPLRLGPGSWRVQPIHVTDLGRIVADLLACAAMPPLLNVVGPEEMTTDALTLGLRNWLGLPPARLLTIPRSGLAIAARIGDALPGFSLTSESLTMLARGNTADSRPLPDLLGWTPRPLFVALAAEPAVAADLWHARLLPLRGLLIGALAVIWVGSGVASFVLPQTDADALLSGLGLSGVAALAVTWAGAALDVVLGL